MIHQKLSKKEIYERFRSTFIVKLKDTLGLVMTESEFDILSEEFKIRFRLGQNNGLGILEFQGRSILTVFSTKYLCFKDFYPDYSHESVQDLVIICFPKTQYALVNQIVNSFNKMCDLLEAENFQDFNDFKNFVYANAIFPRVHISMWNNEKHAYLSLMKKISNIIMGKNKYVTLVPVRKS